LKTSILVLVLLCLVALVVAACAGDSTPESIAGNPTAAAPTALPAIAGRTETPPPTIVLTAGRTETPPPTVAPTRAIPSPTIPKPTATLVPLTTPSVTPISDRPSQASVRRIGVAEARTLAEAGDAVLVDVRTRGTYEQAHIAGAVSLPLDQVAGQIHSLADEALIIFYCA
jgi:hypothetical protein